MKNIKVLALGLIIFFVPMMAAQSMSKGEECNQIKNNPFNCNKCPHPNNLKKTSDGRFLCN